MLATPFPQPTLACKYKLLPLARCETSKGNALLPGRYELLPLARLDLLRNKNHHEAAITNYLASGPDKLVYYECVKHLELHNIESIALCLPKLIRQKETISSSDRISKIVISRKGKFIEIY